LSPCSKWIGLRWFLVCGGLGDQLLCGAVDLCAAPQQAGVGDAESAQCLLDPARFVRRLGVGELFAASSASAGSP
jgi:hypothetical protein